MAKSNIIVKDQENKDRLYSLMEANQRIHANTARDISALSHRTMVTRATAEIVNRSPYYPGTYEASRPFAALPTSFPTIIYNCRTAYYTVGIVRNVIDLLTDFICEDIKIIHGNKKDEAFFRVWAKKIGLYEVVTEFAKHMLIDANVVVKRTTAKITSAVGEQWDQEIKDEQALAKPDVKLYKQKDELKKNEIPIKYSFLNVAALDWDGSEIGQLTGQKTLVFRVAPKIINTMRANSEVLREQLSSNVTMEEFDAVLKTGKHKIDMSKVYIGHVKKDSWQDWAIPYLYAVLKDLMFKEKLRQLDIAATDGTINPIRLWKLGAHKEKIFPESTAIDLLADLLKNNPGGGPYDIIWDDMIDMKDYYPPIDKILAKGKYDEVDKDILVGLGVPEVLLGGDGANFSNSFIQLKTITERVKYIREQISVWLEKELKMLCKAMEIKTMPKVRFGQMNLEDENTTKKLIVDLLDRGIISVEAVLDAYGEDFTIEMDRIRREKPILKSVDVEIVGPFTQNDEPPKGKLPGGRPIKKVETQQRKQRKPKPRRSFAHGLFTAFEKVNELDKILTEIYLKKNKLSNARKLKNEDIKLIDKLRANILPSITPDTELTQDVVLEILADLKIDNNFVDILDEQLKAYVEQKNGELSFNDKKSAETTAWLLYLSDEEE